MASLEQTTFIVLICPIVINVEKYEAGYVKGYHKAQGVSTTTLIPTQTEGNYCAG